MSEKSDTSDPQELSDDALGDFPAGDAEDRVDRSAGDEADATTHGASGTVRGSDAGLGRHEPASVDEENPDQTIEGGNA